ncbi:MAG TPA: alpha-fucosidase [Lachnoclostridium phytofermentans]|uniref:alpha-L-fucosidase n=1 Tax=Lachnoclostridium phytofermentans TaxID=66219 RepID=A0A3D2XCW0_9FIRM|nr:alpha-L-fucosidase [Lachnoclostridium sp.]HCL04433.1 alpha-fucosidase [Lachnoclostridium phytofermentans]
MKQLDERLIKIVPSNRQIRMQKTEFYAFFHFTVNTFTGEEWGHGTESPEIFNPTLMDANQWAQAIKAAGMKGAILTCKHHDGFCLWPSKYTKHSVKYSPYQNGEGDIVKEVTDACREAGLKFGIYLSPWDRNQETYGQGKAYDDYFIAQLTELLTGYGDIFSVWFDGACGEGPNGKKQAYDWQRYYDTIRKYMPEACITISGPDVRWCGNEAGDTRDSEWSVVPADLSVAERVAALSQHADDPSFRQRVISSMEQDLGSRERLAQEQNLIWYPAEVDVSIRPGWFYHPEEDDKVRSLENLLSIYEKSVGGNTTLLLNIPPTPNGLIYETDVSRLQELGEEIKKRYGKNLTDGAAILVKEENEWTAVDCVQKDDYETYYQGIGPQAEFKISFPVPQKISAVILKENILKSQRIEVFEILTMINGNLINIYKGTTVGYKKIARFPQIESDVLIIRILDSRIEPTLSFIGIYE